MKRPRLQTVSVSSIRCILSSNRMLLITMVSSLSFVFILQSHSPSSGARRNSNCLHCISICYQNVLIIPNANINFQTQGTIHQKLSSDRCVTQRQNSNLISFTIIVLLFLSLYKVDIVVLPYETPQAFSNQSILFIHLP